MMPVSKLTNISPIHVIDNKKPAAWATPSPSVLGNIPTLWLILNQIVDDWKTEASKYSPPRNFSSQDEIAIWLFETIDRVTPRFIQCLFSYITFFFILENGYHAIYKDLNQVNKVLGLNLLHAKPPARDAFIRRLWLIWNFSIAHWAGVEKSNILDSVAGQSWGINCQLVPPDIEHLQFGASGVVRYDETTGTADSSSDRRIESIPVIHRLCTVYLERFDEICAKYLTDLKTNLPLGLNNREYFNSPKEKP